MIARDQNEYEIYTKIDQDRYIEEKKDERLEMIKRVYEAEGRPFI